VFSEEKFEIQVRTPAERRDTVDELAQTISRNPSTAVRSDGDESRNSWADANVSTEYPAALTNRPSARRTER
jgi:hypothetical protein